MYRRLFQSASTLISADAVISHPLVQKSRQAITDRRSNISRGLRGLVSFVGGTTEKFVRSQNFNGCCGQSPSGSVALAHNGAPILEYLTQRHLVRMNREGAINGDEPCLLSRLFRPVAGCRNDFRRMVDVSVSRSRIRNKVA